MSSFDFAAYTERVINSIGDDAPPRVKEVFPILIRKFHELLIEADISTEELLLGCDLLVKAGQVSDAKRNEVLLVTDIFGSESLCDVLDATRPERKGLPTAAGETSSSAILGPFYRSDVPVQPNGTTIIRHPEDYKHGYTHLFGTVHGSDGKPLPDATIDIWHDAPDGLYDVQNPHKPDYHCRGRFVTDKDGKYDLVCLKPTPYPIPYDHQAGEVLKLMSRHPYRPAHIHFYIQEPKHRTLVSQIFNSDSDYLTDDAVFAVKDALVVEYKPISKDYKPPADLEGKMTWELQQDFWLQPKEEK